MKLFSLQLGMLQTNCYILAAQTGAAAVIDPGAQGQRVEQLLLEQGLDLKLILLTHAHFDHTGGVRYLKERFPQAQVLVGEKDMPLYQSSVYSLADQLGAPGEGENLPCDRWLKNGEQVALDELSLAVLETPGHTPGSVCYIAGSCLFSGDTLFLGSAGRTDFYFGDAAQLRQSLKVLYHLPGDYTVYPGHGPKTTLERERLSNPFMN